MNNDEKWQPKNVPDVKRDFEGKYPEKTSSLIATKWELEKLIAERRNPLRNLDYTPDSIAKTRHQDRIKKLREERIGYIEDLFVKHRARVRDDFNSNADDHLQKQSYKTMTDKELDDFYQQKRDKGRGGRER